MENIKDINQNKENIEEFIEENRETLTKIAKEIISRRIWLQINCTLWILTNIILIIVFYFVKIDFRILGWTAIPWGFAVALHTFNYKAFRNGWFGTTNEYVYGYGWFLYLFVSFLTAFIDFFESDAYTLDWWHWVFLGLSIAIIVETVVYFILRRKL